MNVYHLTAISPRRVGTIRREIMLPAGTPAGLLSDTLLIAFRWEDGEDFAFTNERDEALSAEDLPTVAGMVSALGAEIIYRSGKEELYLSFKLEAADGQGPASPKIVNGTGDDFDAEELNLELKEMLDEESAGNPYTVTSAADRENAAAGTVIDADAENESLALQPAWLEAEHGIRVSAENVRNVPADLRAFRNNLTEDDLATPRAYLRKIRPLFEKYPEDPLLNFEMAGLYGMTGEGKKSRQLLRKVNRKFSGNLEVLIHRALALENEVDFVRFIGDLPRPLDIRNHAAGEDGYYHATEFLGFEEIAIREAVHRNDLNEARFRLDRLVRFGFLHGDVENAAMMIAGMMIIDVQEKIESGAQSFDDYLSDAFAPISERTKTILDISISEVAEMMKAYEQEHEPVRRQGPKMGRNDPCPCGSGKKFKKCCR